MTEPYLAQVLPFGFNFAPRSWAQCQGQLLSIRQFTALFSLLGTNFGGDGVSIFGLPDLRGTVPVGAGSGSGRSDYVVGETGGEPSVTLLQNEMTMHTHPLMATTSPGTLLTAANTQLAEGTSGGKSGAAYQARIYSTNLANATTSLAPTSLTPMGQSLPHNNMQPYLAVNFCIALSGVFAPRS